MRGSRMFLHCAFLTGSLASAGGSVFGQSLPPGPTSRFQSTFDVVPPDSAFEIVQLVLDFGPGAWTPSHVHGGQTLNTVLGGEITLRERGAERRLRPGQAWSDRAGHVQ